MDFDALIIGSGAGGSMVALRLCEAGFKVGLIERGPQFDPNKDYILNYSDWEVRDDPLKNARLPDETIDQTYLTPTSFRGKTAQRSAFRYYRVHGVGGSTLHYQGEAHRFAAHSFTTKSDFGWGEDWPLTYQDIEPYYEQAEKLIGVAGTNDNPHKPARGKFPTPAHPLSPRSQLLKRSASKVGLTLLQNTLALPSRSLDGRLPCQHSGGCNFGCVFGAKSSTDQAIVPKAEATGNLTLLTETRVTRLALSTDGELRGVHGLQSGEPVTFTAKAYVLAGGAVETPRLMLNASSSRHPNGYFNRHDQLGRYFMETVMAHARLDVDAPIRTFSGPPLDSRIWDYCRPKDNQTSGFVLGSSGYLYPQTGPGRHAIGVDGVGRAHKQQVRDTFGKRIELFGVAEQVPIASNRLTLSERKDSAGVPMVKVHCEYTEQDRHTTRKMRELLDKWAQATPHTSLGAGNDSILRSSATHVGGGCRMGNDPKQSVVDALGKVHGSSNCYVADASVLVTQGAGDSPSLTIQALALRTADGIVEDLKRG